MSTPCAPMWRHPLFALALMLIFALVTPASFAQNKTEDALKDWPSRPITILAGSHVGGVFDKMTRGFATHPSKELARPVIVQNISGTPIKAGNYLLRQPDDGYTFLISAPDDLKPVINVPTVNQMLEDQGKSVIFLPSSLKSIIAPKGFQMKYPDRYKKIKKIFEKVAKSNAFIQDMKKRIVGVDWQGEKASTIETLNAYDLFVGYNDLLKKYE